MPLLVSQQRLRRRNCPGTDHFRLDYVELAQQGRRAGGDFVFFREAIFRRAAFHHVADVNVVAAQAHGFDHLREQFSRAADEGLALTIFIVAGAFADENQIGFRVADAEDDVAAPFVEFAARAIADVGADAVERVVFDPVNDLK